VGFGGIIRHPSHEERPASHRNGLRHGAEQPRALHRFARPRHSHRNAHLCTGAIRGGNHRPVVERGGGCQVSLALDAPLGWPTDIAVIAGHSAGAPLSADRNRMFCRETDRFIRRQLGQQSLDVGADCIARTAHAALALLQEIRDLVAETIPLASDPELSARVSAIEVYPAATLRAHRLRFAGYKKPNQLRERQEIVDALSSLLIMAKADLPSAQPDVLDAVVCLLAGGDFMSGRSMPPEQNSLCAPRGWIGAMAPRDESRR
jgi:hypothetical protein